jgi:hypothetical protein
MLTMPIPSKTGAEKGKHVTVSYSDSINLVNDQVSWSPKGVSLLTKWAFRVGAEVEFAFDHMGERHGCSGVVVACHPLQEPLGFYETVLFFVETPGSKLQKAASACRLSREQKPAQDEAEANGVPPESEGSPAPRSRSSHSRR